MAAKKNYNKISTENAEAVETVTEPIAAETVTEPITEESKTEVVTGVVVKCSKLNVRKKADIESKVICVIDAGTKVTMPATENTSKDFYEVILENGKTGFCMKKYIEIKQ